MYTDNQFKSTKSMFRTAISGGNYKFPLSFETWNSAPEQDKLPLLFLNFYSDITYAWMKSQAPFIVEDDAISVLLVKLNANVPIITEHPCRFTHSYIRTVSYNCMACLRRVKCNIERNAVEASMEFNSNNTEDGLSTSLLDLIPSNEDSYEVAQAKEATWEIISHMGPKAEKVVNHLINGSSLKRSKRNNNDPLGSICVNQSEFNDIIGLLRTNLAPNADLFGITL